MRILVAGGTGVIGARVARLLAAAGHHVTATSRSAERASALTDDGVHGTVMDVLDAARVRSTVLEAKPDIVLHQVTDLPDRAAALLFKVRALGRVRTLGTDNLIAAAAAADARVIAQSIAFPVPGPAQRPIDHLERAVLGARGLVLRYGQFWGPGTWAESSPGERGLHIDTAAAATVEALDEPPGVLEILDTGVTRVG